MDKEYTQTLRKLKQMKDMTDDVNLTLDRQLEFDEKIKGYLEDLISTIEAEGTVSQ